VYACEKCLPKGDEWAGSRIGDYEVLKRLGQGGMGIVYLVCHRPTARLWALKQMKDLKTVTPRAVQA
jgi:serine/threonine protein kinase